MTDRPSLYVTRRLPEAVERHLRAHWDVTLSADDRPPEPAELAAAMARYDALLPTITDRIDAELLGRPDRRVRQPAERDSEGDMCGDVAIRLRLRGDEARGSGGGARNAMGDRERLCDRGRAEDCRWPRAPSAKVVHRSNGPGCA